VAQELRLSNHNFRFTRACTHFIIVLIFYIYLTPIIYST